MGRVHRVYYSANGQDLHPPRHDVGLLTGQCRRSGGRITRLPPDPGGATGPASRPIFSTPAAPGSLAASNPETRPRYATAHRRCNSGTSKRRSMTWSTLRAQICRVLRLRPRPWGNRTRVPEPALRPDDGPRETRAGLRSPLAASIFPWRSVGTSRTTVDAVDRVRVIDFVRSHTRPTELRQPLARRPAHPLGSFDPTIRCEPDTAVSSMGLGATRFRSDSAGSR